MEKLKLETWTKNRVRDKRRPICKKQPPDKIRRIFSEQYETHLNRYSRR